MGFGDDGYGRGSALVVCPEEFAGIDRACVEFLEVIERVSEASARIGSQTRWGLGEGDARLISGPALVARFRATADAVCVAMAVHRRIVDDIRDAHRMVHDRMVAADQEWGARITEAEAVPGHSFPTIGDR
ncbi:hypothetical protein [Nocardia caishijiensis]|uniref:Excreted virulence factor EspC (Type VII ESX diderm) n=1 Tax=Nocardia caishijiensis TaxID=184756 RepID=A0ABQ6YJ14_9NOCA|nr:hypothetical protein [Nocardia caishijiensis]KAF0845799.1 hypothetical protein FNL39_106188 [Nocardia caishijiensis]